MLKHPNIEVKIKAISSFYFFLNNVLCNLIKKRDVETIELLLTHPKFDIDASSMNISLIKHFFNIVANSIANLIKNNDLEILKILLSNPKIDINNKVKNIFFSNFK